MPRTPKQMFLASGYAKRMQEIVANEAFEPACAFALLQLRSEMPRNCLPGVPTDVMLGFDANAQMVGAERVLAILATLWEPETPPEPIKRPTLNYVQ